MASAGREATRSPVATFQIASAPSPVAVASRAPSGVKASGRRLSREPVLGRPSPETFSNRPVATSNNLANPSRHAEAMHRPSGLKARFVTRWVWPSKARIRWPVSASQRMTAPGVTLAGPWVSK